mmetsp:Transcript_18574/g.26136  ORF Transcript_18574/g.26136 Transcript_18574/m.26136 type:complete len:338 (-) Transcript_18574:219-1232(-)
MKNFNPKLIACACIFFQCIFSTVQAFVPSSCSRVVNPFGTPTSSSIVLKRERIILASDFSEEIKKSDISFDDELSEDELQLLRQKDPIGYLINDIKKLDINAVINTAVLVGVAVAVLSRLATVDSAIMRGWTTSEMAVRIPIDNWNDYSAILDKSPLSTKAITSATVYTIGDFIAQASEGVKIGEIDRPRILRSLLAGLIGHGPLSHIWYDASEHLFDDVLRLDPNQWWTVIPKVAIDQATWGPFWNNTYILLLGLMKRDSLMSIWNEVKRTTIPLIVSGLKLWPLAHVVTYGLVPVENRLLWVDLVEIIWVTILATAAAGGESSGHGVSVKEDESS